MTLEDEPPRLAGVLYATGEEQRAITNSSRKNEAVEPKWKKCSAAVVTGGENKVQCCKDQYHIITWNIRFINQGKQCGKAGNGKLEY